ncbi:hypothetical protein [Desulfosporosinus sp. BICA1-9]|uniref:hypothetical protein n=1 Tax=Desulfosporosinus sp. BICA1-9 TaxID=1531958 RepID=UPI00054C10C8|nr:hypothetical protein [Desulfosporosinus sp. BICA1-9]KJS90265.1 MAG: hypothetical protein JL57_02750 [Desulfosporosinus sp. BICA1-9]
MEKRDILEPINLLAIGYAKGEVLSSERHNQVRKSLMDFVSFETYDYKEERVKPALLYSYIIYDFYPFLSNCKTPTSSGSGTPGSASVTKASCGGFRRAVFPIRTLGGEGGRVHPTARKYSSVDLRLRHKSPLETYVTEDSMFNFS